MSFILGMIFGIAVMFVIPRVMKRFKYEEPKDEFPTKKFPRPGNMGRK